MKFSSRKSIVGLALALATGLASAGTVTFDGLRDSVGADPFSLVASGGLIFASEGPNLYAPGDGQGTDPHGEGLVSLNSAFPLLVIKDASLTPFNLLSFDLGSVPSVSGDAGGGDDSHDDHSGTGNGDYVGSSGDIWLYYVVASNPDNLGLLKFHIDETPGLTTFQVGLQDISFFALGNLPGDDDSVPFELDDVVTTSAVPEPGSLAAMLAGLGMLAMVARRRRG